MLGEQTACREQILWFHMYIAFQQYFWDGYLLAFLAIWQRNGTGPRWMMIKDLCCSTEHFAIFSQSALAKFDKWSFPFYRQSWLTYSSLIHEIWLTQNIMPVASYHENGGKGPLPALGFILQGKILCREWFPSPLPLLWQILLIQHP